MRTIVTGGAGFLGSHLCEALVTRGDSVLCVDNLSTGSLENISHLLGVPTFRFIEADVSATMPVPGAVDVVALLVNPASPPDHLRHPAETLAVGSRGTENALALARGHDAGFASTSEVYGDPAVLPQSEDYWGNVHSVGPRSAYDEAQRYAEALSAAYRREFGTNVGIVRIFNAFGPRMRPHDGRVVTNFVVQAVNGDPLTIYGDGSRTRSFCYVDDLIRGLVAMIDSAEARPINLGNPVEYSVVDLAALVLRITRSLSPVRHHPLPCDDPTHRRPGCHRRRPARGRAGAGRRAEVVVRLTVIGMASLVIGRSSEPLAARPGL